MTLLSLVEPTKSLLPEQRDHSSKDQIKILDGSFDIDAANSAVKAKNTDDGELGNIYMPVVFLQSRQNRTDSSHNRQHCCR